MALRDLVVNGVKLADTITNNGKLQGTVLYRRAISTDYEGTVTYDPPLSQPATELRAVVEWKQQSVKTKVGVLDMSKTKVSILDLDGLRVASGGVGLREDDMIVLPDGTTGPLMALNGYMDPITAQPFMTEAQIG